MGTEHEEYFRWVFVLFPLLVHVRVCCQQTLTRSGQKPRREMTNVIRKVLPAAVATLAGWTRRWGERNSQILKFSQQKQRGYDDDVMLLLCVVRFCGWFSWKLSRFCVELKWGKWREFARFSFGSSARTLYYERICARTQKMGWKWMFWFGSKSWLLSEMKKK